ncbi:hypothetical protein MAR_001292, partial [Mya arenaria]
VLHISYKNVNTDNVMFDSKNIYSEIEEDVSEKDLGIHFSNSLSFDSHINKTVNKANSLIGLFKRNFKHKQIIENCQRRATKLVLEISHLPYEQRFIELNLPSLEYRKLQDSNTLKSLLVGSFDVAQKLTDSAGLASLGIICKEPTFDVYPQVLSSLNEIGKDVVKEINPWVINTLVDWCNFDNVICSSPLKSLDTQSSDSTSSTDCSQTSSTGCSQTSSSGCSQTSSSGCSQTSSAGCSQTSSAGCSQTLSSGCSQTSSSGCSQTSSSDCSHTSSSGCSQTSESCKIQASISPLMWLLPPARGTNTAVVREHESSIAEI